MHSYWQLLFHSDSQQCQSLLTGDGVYSPTRALHVAKNAVTNLRSSLTLTLPQEPKTSLLLWLNDCLLESPSTIEFLHGNRSFLSYCIYLNWKLNLQSLSCSPGRYAGLGTWFLVTEFDTVQLESIRYWTSSDRQRAPSCSNFFVPVSGCGLRNLCSKPWFLFCLHP